ncbi:hypothetical protein D3C72_2500370 [compost metagenome]
MTQGQQDGLDRQAGVHRCRALERDEGNRMILGDGADQGVDGVTVTIVPQTRKGAAF